MGMIMLTRKLTWLLLISLTCVAPATAQGLIVNEYSNGASGVKEYLEMVVVGTGPNLACGPVDIRTWIFDDNNGDFSCGPCASRGVAQGHMRFANLPVWSAVPTGSIILVYNSDDFTAGFIPADDPDDTAPADGVYIVPSNHISLEASSTPCAINIPNATGTCPACTGNAGYAAVCYTAGSASAWDNCGLRNTGDAMQVRRPDGSYFHGIANESAGAGMLGGPDNMLFNSTGTGRAFMFDNTSGNNNFRLIGNYVTVLAASGTPGAANSLNNAAWIDILRNDCILPIVYAQPFSGRVLPVSNRLLWSTAQESNTRHFVIERASSADAEFEEIGRVPAAGSSSELLEYGFTDAHPLATSYYRLSQYDRDGMVQHSGVVELNRQVDGIAKVNVWPHPAGDQLNYDVQGDDLREIALLDGMGRVIFRRDMEAQTSAAAGAISLSQLSDGVYFLQVRSGRGVVREKIVHIH